jgi:hypothetical protein
LADFRTTDFTVEGRLSRIKDNLRHTWASWHRQAGTSCVELKDLGGLKTRTMVDRYAKFATDNLAFAAARIELSRVGEGADNVVNLSRFSHVTRNEKGQRLTADL